MTHLNIKYVILDNLYPRQKYPYFNVVAGLVWSEDPESYAGGSIATGRGYLA
jgi:hypothetical protein